MGYKLKRILIYPDGVTEKQVYPKTRNPGANTIAYYPLTSTTTVNEMSGKNKILTNSGVTFGVYKGVDCANLNGSSYLYNMTQYGLSGNFTALIWCYFVARGDNQAPNPRFYGNDNGNIGIWINRYNYIGYNPKGGETSTQLTSDSGWCLLVVTYDGTNCKLYVNTTNVDTTAKSGYSYTDIALGIGKYAYPSNNFFKGGLSRFILENKARTATEISNYYNLTKSNYGL